MATARLVPSAYTLSSATAITATNPENAYTNIDSTSIATFNTTQSGTSNIYFYLHGFNFSDIPSNAIVSSFSVKIKGYESGINTGTSYAPCLTYSTTTISGTTASENFDTSTKTITFPWSGTWDNLKNYGNNLRIRLNLRRSSRNTVSYLYIYGAEIEVTYSAETVHVTGVTLNKSSTSLEVGATETLTATVAPNNAADKTVSWSSNNTSVATVDSSGVVTAVSTGTAIITVTTTDGSYTDTCAVTVTAPVLTQYKVTNTMVAGKSYLIANGNSGSVYMLSNEANGSRTLKGVATTVTDGIISISSSVASKCLFECVETQAGNDITTGLMNDSKYIYCDNSNGLRMNTVQTLDRWWHYVDNKFWQFKNSSSNGYTDTSSEYKYYLTWSNGNATDSHVDTTSIQNSNIPLTYFFTEYVPSDEELYVKVNGTWTQATKVYKKVNGTWTEQNDLSNVFDNGTNYKMV